MKNKKSKIIVPALGLILLSTTASISGSVAWFTANRSVEVQANLLERSILVVVLLIAIALCLEDLV